MANNYLKSSFDVRGLTREQAEWAVAVLSKAAEFDALRPEDVKAAAPYTDPLEKLAYEMWEHDFGVVGETEIEDRADKIGVNLWVGSDSWLDIEGAGLWLHGVMAHFDLDLAWGFTWAETCDKLRIAEFTGGACIITREGPEFFNATTWLQDKLDAHKAARKAVV